MAIIKTIDSLTGFLSRRKITIQCHNYPDADTIGSGFALWQYFSDHGIDARLVYGGSHQIAKSNLRMFVDKLHIPIEHVKDGYRTDGLLITVDCQYLSSNIIHIEADEVLMIDHHRQGENIDRIRELDIECHSCIKEHYGSCASVVYQLFQKSRYSMSLEVSTALYYGLYMDTNEFSEVRYPADREARDELVFDDRIFMLLKNSNLSAEELKQAGASLQNYDSKGQLAVIESVQCDPNVLGMIADMMIRVENINTAIVFNRLSRYDHNPEQSDIYKFSVRTCVGEIRANELAELIAAPMVDSVRIGGGGGHRLKAGGRVNVGLFEKYLREQGSSETFNEYLYRVFEEYSSIARIIYSDSYDFDDLVRYAEKYEETQYVMGYVCSTEIAEEGRPLLIRGTAGDVREKVSPELYIMVSCRGEVVTVSRSEFLQRYRDCEGPLNMVDFSEYDEPRIVIDQSGRKFYLKNRLHCCTFRKPQYVWVVPIEKLGIPVKLVDSKWASSDFRFGNITDYLVINEKQHSEISIVDSVRFSAIYKKV